MWRDRYELHYQTCHHWTSIDTRYKTTNFGLKCIVNRWIDSYRGGPNFGLPCKSVFLFHNNPNSVNYYEQAESIRETCSGDPSLSVSIVLLTCYEIGDHLKIQQRDEMRWEIFTKMKSSYYIHFLIKIFKKIEQNMWK